MRNNRYILVFVLLFALMSSKAEEWRTYFAYNNVTQITMASDKVYALSDGSLFSVNKQTEEIQVYSHQSGLHATGISCILYDTATKQLIIGYKTGKIDLLSKRGVKYLGELYDKDMTQRKTIHNITIHKHTAYLSTAFGIQTLDLRTDRLVDSYWLRPGGIETDVLDVVVNKDSIYAFTTDSMFCADLKDNLSDYTFWRREVRSSRISPDPEKGKHCTDNSSDWYAAGDSGIQRTTVTETVTYKPDGPLSNIPYCIRAIGNKVGVVQGGYDAAFFHRSAVLMILEGDKWHNYDAAYFKEKLGMKCTDLCDIAFDPHDHSHFFVASFGYGLIEFRNNEFYAHYNHKNSSIEGILPTSNYPYLWLDGLKFDDEGNLWLLNLSSHGIKVLRPDGTWVLFNNEACAEGSRPRDLLISRKKPSIKITCDLKNRSIGVMDDNGTLEDESDDRAASIRIYTDKDGNEFTIPEYILSLCQKQDGALLMATNSGLFQIADPESILDGNTRCDKVHVADPDEWIDDIFESARALCVLEDKQGRIWVGTDLYGLFCLSSDLKNIIYHFSTENSALPSNYILSLALQEETDYLFIGTSEGLMMYNEHGSSSLADSGEEKEDDYTPSEGSMLNWRLHFSYSDPQEIAATPQQVFAVANGSLFSVDREDESIHYWDKSAGLSGSSVSHIAYDPSSRQLIIAYLDGRLDLLHDNGEVTQMPDLTMKAGSVQTDINCISIGSLYTYVGTPFGIMAINTRKGEISDTYYIGEEASSMDVQQIVEFGDSLYAFSYDRMYKAALKDNLVDYTFWHKEDLPFDEVQQATVWHDTLYILHQDSLYRRKGTQWSLVTEQSFRWIHSSGDQLLAYNADGVFRLAEDGLIRITSNYHPNDGVYTRGEYWLAQSNTGLIRINNSGVSYFNAGGPNSNIGYFITTAHDQVYSTIGGRWTGPYVRFGRINIYDGKDWMGITNNDIGGAVGKSAVDISSIAVDHTDPGHFFAATFGRGLFEFRDYKAWKCYTSENSPLREASSGDDPDLYTLTDGATIDDEGNLWVLNQTTVGKPIHILTPNGVWYSLQPRVNGSILKFTTPFGIWSDKRDSRYKWMLSQRGTNKGVIFLYDGGTPTYGGDDYCVLRETFVDQNGHILSPNAFRCLVQDQSNRIWIGTESGLFTIPSSVDFFSSNACHRIIIPRNDGTGLGDYLLGDEQINCLALDGGNRMWIGTENSGLYLIEDDTITVAHFTESNSLLPSNTIMSIAILPKTGEVFVGTDKGIASYRSDASEPQPDMSGVYAYPNPVRPGYEGQITITGLMDNTVVNIVDSGGNLVCKTRSHGGTAVWDGKLYDGRKATPGVYSALCNTNGGHTVVKILIMR